jgi:hypothetical protein
VKRQASQAWLEIGYTVPELPVLNAEAQLARVRDRQEFQEKRAAHDALPARRVDAKSAFARMHAVVEAGGEC